MSEPRIYRIVSVFDGGNTKTVKEGLTLREAKHHCRVHAENIRKANERGAKPWWSGGYDYMPGCRHVENLGITQVSGNGDSSDVTR
jgi:hypothetical protein